MRSKMIKGLAASLAAVLLMSTAVFAAGSVTFNGDIETGSVLIDGQPMDKDTHKVVFEDEKAVPDDVAKTMDAEVVTKIDEINEEPAKVSEVLTEAQVAAGDTIDVSKLQMLTKIQDLSVRLVSDSSLVADAKNVTVTWEVPNLAEGLGEVRVLHYSTHRNLWEILKPDSVDYAGKAITQTFEDLSPVAVVYVPAEGGTTTGSTDNVKTGDTSNMALYVVIAAAAVVVISALAIAKKKAAKN